MASHAGSKKILLTITQEAASQIKALVAFTPGVPVQPEGAVDGVRLFYSGVPILGTMLAMWIMRDYDLDERRATEVNAELARRRQRANPSSSQGSGSGARPWLADHGLLLPGAEPSALAGKTSDEIRALYAEQFQRGVYGLCFIGYAQDQRAGDVLSPAQVGQRIDLVAPHARWVRSFSCTEAHELIPKLARARGLKTVVGAWISHDRERNEREIEALIRLAREGVVDIAVVGNEVLLRGELPEQDLLAYIARVKAAGGEDKLVIVAETGWPSQGLPVAAAIPSPENAMKYFIDVQQWACGEGVKLFDFSSFDEPWKLGQEGSVGASWGLWDRDGQPKYA